ncbi:MAG: hypothetical protein M4579_001365 [Chaenotheca gracillima]|nr:MAG: hypothetical protein M4579_001365 [Chaenotheca gracillima]
MSNDDRPGILLQVVCPEEHYGEKDSTPERLPEVYLPQNPTFSSSPLCSSSAKSTPPRLIGGSAVTTPASSPPSPLSPRNAPYGYDGHEFSTGSPVQRTRRRGFQPMERPSPELKEAEMQLPRPGSHEDQNSLVAFRHERPALDKTISEPYFPTQGSLPEPKRANTLPKMKSMTFDSGSKAIAQTSILRSEFEVCKKRANLLDLLRKKAPIPPVNVSKPPFKKDYVYIFSRKSSFGHVKIGRSMIGPPPKGELHERIRKQGAACEYKDELMKVPEPNLWGTQYYLRLEQIVHADLAKVRKMETQCHGGKGCKLQTQHQEWFEIRVCDAQRVVRVWSDWLKMEPYDANRCLKDEWVKKLKVLEGESKGKTSREGSVSGLWAKIIGLPEIEKDLSSAMVASFDAGHSRAPITSKYSAVENSASKTHQRQLIGREIGIDHSALAPSDGYDSARGAPVESEFAAETIDEKCPTNTEIVAAACEHERELSSGIEQPSSPTDEVMVDVETQSTHLEPDPSPRESGKDEDMPDAELEPILPELPTKAAHADILSPEQPVATSWIWKAYCALLIIIAMLFFRGFGSSSISIAEKTGLTEKQASFALVEPAIEMKTMAHCPVDGGHLVVDEVV